MGFVCSLRFQCHGHCVVLPEVIADFRWTPPPGLWAPEGALSYASFRGCYRKEGEDSNRFMLNPGHMSLKVSCSIVLTFWDSTISPQKVLRLTFWTTGPIGCMDETVTFDDVKLPAVDTPKRVFFDYALRFLMKKNTRYSWQLILVSLKVESSRFQYVRKIENVEQSKLIIAPWKPLPVWTLEYRRFSRRPC